MTQSQEHQHVQSGFVAAGARLPIPPTALSPHESLIATLVVSNYDNEKSDDDTITPNDSFRIMIWSLPTKSLQGTLHYRGNDNHQSVTMKDAATTNKENNNKSYFIKLLFLQEYYIAVAWHTKVVVWDIRRGVVAHQISYDGLSTATIIDIAGDISTKNDIASTATSPQFFHVLTTKSIKDPHKLIIQEYNIVTGKLHRIIKAGKIDELSSSSNNATTTVPHTNTLLPSRIQLISTQKYFIVFSLYYHLGIRVLDRTDGSKVSKISESKLRTAFLSVGKNDNKQPADDNNVLALCTAANDSYMIVFMEQHIIMIDIINGTILHGTTKQHPSSSTKKDSTSIFPTIPILQQTRVQFMKHTTAVTDDDNNSRYWILLGNQILYRVVIDSLARTYQLQQAIVIDVKNSHDNDDAVTIAYLSSTTTTKMHTILYHYQRQQVQVQSRYIESSLTEDYIEKVDATMLIDWNDENTKKTTKNKKRKNEEEIDEDHDNDANEALLQKNKRAIVEESDKLDDDEDDEYNEEAPTVGDRLKWLQEALGSSDEDDEDDTDKKNRNQDAIMKDGSKSKITKNDKITTESLTMLLQQAIQSNDHALLELALAVNDSNMIYATLHGMDINDIMILIVHITNRIAAKPKRLEQLLKWIQSILNTLVTIDSNGINVEMILRPLRNLLLERVEVYSDFVQLQGKIQSIM